MDKAFLFVMALQLLSMSSSVLAEDDLAPVRLFSNASYDLNANMRILEDPTNELTIDQVATQKYDADFISHGKGIPNLGISQSTYWIKTKVIYPDSYPNKDNRKKWFLEVGRSNLDISELFIPETDGVYTVITSDTRSEFSEKEVVHVNSVFPVTTLLDQEVMFYIKIKSKTSMYFPVTLWTPEGFAKKVAIEEFLYGVFLGAMTILLTYNLFLYVSVRDVGYLYYVFYLGSITLVDVLESGHGTIHIGSFLGFIEREYILLLLSVTAISTMLFAKNFMSTAKDYPMLDFTLNFMAIISLMTACVFFVTEYKVASIWNQLAFTGFMPIFLCIVAYCWFHGNQNAKFLFFAWIFNVVGLTVFSGISIKLLPTNVFTLSALPLGILAEAVLLSFALSNRIKNESNAVLLADRKAMLSLSRYESVFNNAREGMYEMSLAGKVISANPAILRMFGFDDFRQLCGCGSAFGSHLFRDTNSQFREMLGGEVSSNDLCFIRKRGEKVWAHHSARLIFGKNGSPSHIEGTILNVTQQKLKEIAVKGQEREHTEKVIAEASTNAKSEFLANMSHEIRTPLTAIIGFSESLKEVNLSPSEKKSATDLVVDNSHTLLRLINDILDFSKIEADKLDVEELVVNVSEVVGSIREPFVARAKEKGLRFDVVYRYPIPSIVLSDPTRISQVLGNLCENAIKFTEKGSVLLVVSWNEEINKLQFEVIDSGLGVLCDDQQKLFQVFDQADTSSTRAHGGSGLGLAISQKLAVMMGGNIEVLSEVNKGSVFTFTVGAKLPESMVWIRSAEFSPSLSSPLSPSHKTKKSFAASNFSGTVLLAEDNIVNQKLIERVLKKTGVSVVVVSDGVEACDYCDSALPDFILMDINMPNRDGLEATRYIRDKGHTLPIYALTAETSKEELDKAIDAGCDGFLSKPLNKELLVNAMAEHLSVKLG